MEWWSEYERERERERFSHHIHGLSQLNTPLQSVNANWHTHTHTERETHSQFLVSVMIFWQASHTEQQIRPVLVKLHPTLFMPWLRWSEKPSHSSCHMVLARGNWKWEKNTHWMSEAQHKQTEDSVKVPGRISWPYKWALPGYSINRDRRDYI